MWNYPRDVIIATICFLHKAYGRCYSLQCKIQMTCASSVSKEFAAKVAYHQLKFAYQHYLHYSTTVSLSKYVEKYTVN